MQVAAHRPKEVLALDEEVVFGAAENALLYQFDPVGDPVEILGDPEQRLQVAQPALAVLDVRFDEIARFAHPLVAGIALRKLGVDEFRRAAGNDFLVEALLHFVEQRFLAIQETRVEDRRADRRVRVRKPDALVDGTRRVADRQAQVPQHVEDVFGELFAERRLLVGQHEQEVDIGARRQRAASVAADRDQRQPFALREIGNRKHARQREIVDRAHHRIEQVGKALRAGPSAAVLEELFFRRPPAFGQHRFQMREHLRPASRIAAIAEPVGNGVQVGEDGLVAQPGQGRFKVFLHQGFRHSTTGLLQKLCGKVTRLHCRFAAISFNR
jgi:hypothetical protein